MFQTQTLGDDVTIQFQEPTGEWVPCGRAPNQQPLIQQAERDAERSHPGKRIRAVNSSGSVVDIWS